MAVIAWKEIYQTGIVAFDNEHQELVAEINRLYEAIRDKHGESILGDTLAMLEKYTVEHFQHEEKLMSEYNFPGLEDHQRCHQELIDAVGEIKGRFESGTEELANELLKFLRIWLLEHIVDVDKKYGPYLEARGGRFVT